MMTGAVNCHLFGWKIAGKWEMVTNELTFALRLLGDL